MRGGSGARKKGRVDWAKIARTSQAEIEEQAASEKRRLHISDHHLSPAWPVFRCPDIRQLRERLGLSQSEFAERYALSRRTLQQWEQERSCPDQPARILLKAIEAQPEVMHQIIRRLGKIRDPNRRSARA
jgi:putative transcriptional regulator